MTQSHKYVGLDVYKERNEADIADSGGEVRLYDSISNDLHSLEKLVYKLRGDGVVLHFVYEAGPCGFVVHRRLQHLGEDCVVVAPSLIPRKSGDRVKTDRRDNRHRLQTFLLRHGYKYSGKSAWTPAHLR